MSYANTFANIDLSDESISLKNTVCIICGCITGRSCKDVLAFRILHVPNAEQLLLKPSISLAMASLSLCDKVPFCPWMVSSLARSKIIALSKATSSKDNALVTAAIFF